MKNIVLPLALVLVAVFAVVVYAQMGPPMPPGDRPGMPQMQMGHMPVMLSEDDGYLYILRGDQLTKVRRSDLHVEKTVMLPKPLPPMPPMPGGEE